VYVYFSSDTAGRIGAVTDGTTSYDFATLGPAAISGTNALFTLTTDTSGLFPAADYAVFSGETSSTLTITCNALGGNDQWLGIAGFQLVQVPEPSSAILLLAAGCAAVALRRNRNLNSIRR
jgi:hypothetical protein